MEQEIIQIMHTIRSGNPIPAKHSLLNSANYTGYEIGTKFTTAAEYNFINHNFSQYLWYSGIEFHNNSYKPVVICVSTGLPLGINNERSALFVSPNRPHGFPYSNNYHITITNIQQIYISSFM